ncbi:hypothetical protein [Inquilinus sp. CAU 1745]|uniref:hypothetical protein n=1 Tax=Inquilinus sp. CAU 1745 TaxID=3140369 RepID=UPI00325A4439
MAQHLIAFGVAVVLSAAVGGGGHWAVTRYAEQWAIDRQAAREAALLAEQQAEAERQATAEAERAAAEAAEAEARRRQVAEMARSADSGGFNPMARAAAPIAGMAAGPSTPTDPEFGDLPVSEGMEETFYLCSACHSTAIIRQQHVSDARWDYLWNWMIEEQGMPEQSPEQRELILSYLKRHFSSER